MFARVVPALFLAFIGCASEEKRAPKSSWDVAPPSPPIAEAPEAEASKPTRKPTIVLGTGGSPAYDAMTREQAAAQGSPSNVIIVQQQQTVNGGYGYGVPYGYGTGYGYGYGNTGVGRSDGAARPSTGTAPLAPGGNWPTIPSYGPRMVGDHSR